MSSLNWESACTDEPGDQNAGTYLHRRGHWQIGPTGDGRWSAQLIKQNEHTGDEIEGGAHIGTFATEWQAKNAAEAFENGVEL